MARLPALAAAAAALALALLAAPALAAALAASPQVQLTMKQIEPVLRAARALAARPSAAAAAALAREFWDLVGPGGRLHPAWLLAHQGHLVVEGGLLALLAFMFLQRATYRPKRSAPEDTLTEKARARTRPWQPRAAGG